MVRIHGLPFLDIYDSSLPLTPPFRTLLVDQLHTNPVFLEIDPHDDDDNG